MLDCSNSLSDRLRQGAGVETPWMGSRRVAKNITAIQPNLMVFFQTRTLPASEEPANSDTV